MRRSLTSFTLLVALSAGCSDDGSGPDGGGITTDLELAGAGFDDTGVEGFGELDLPNAWTHLFGSKADADFDRLCRDLQQCGVAGVVASLGPLTGEAGNFALVTTGDFQCDPNDFSGDPADCANPAMPVAVSGMGTFGSLVDTDDGQEWTSATLVFRYALLSAREDAAGAADSVVINAGPFGGPMTTVLRLSAGSLGGSLPLRVGGCGTQVLPDPGGIATTYPTCSEWQDASADISEFIGQETAFQFIAGEAGAAVALAVDDVKIELSR